MFLSEMERVVDTKHLYEEAMAAGRAFAAQYRATMARLAKEKAIQEPSGP